MEEALLKDMVVERDKKIAQLEETVKEHEEKLQVTKEELDQVQQESS